jgi:predicted RNA-binding protein YlxR (DUF448 family)
MTTRTCVVTRKRYDTSVLVRLQLDEQGVVVIGRPGGRGAWIDPSWSVVKKLEQKPGMARRSLRRTPRTAEGLTDRVRAHLIGQLQRSLLTAWRSGTLRFVTPSAALGGVVLLPSDAPQCHEGAVTLPWTVNQLSGLLNRPTPQALVTLPSRPSRLLLRDLHRWRCLGYPPSPLTDASLLRAPDA